MFLETPTLDCIIRDPLRMLPIKSAVRMIANGLLRAIKATGIPPVSYTHLTLPTNSRV